MSFLVGMLILATHHMVVNETVHANQPVPLVLPHIRQPSTATFNLTGHAVVKCYCEYMPKNATKLHREEIWEIPTGGNATQVNIGIEWKGCKRYYLESSKNTHVTGTIVIVSYADAILFGTAGICLILLIAIIIASRAKRSKLSTDHVA